VSLNFYHLARSAIVDHRISGEIGAEAKITQSGRLEITIMRRCSTPMTVRCRSPPLSDNLPLRPGRSAPADRIADEVISHLTALVGPEVKVTLEIEAEVPNGVPENTVPTVTENSRTLKFDSQGFEKE
jgi:hypothetical protein